MTAATPTTSHNQSLLWGEPSTISDAQAKGTTGHALELTATAASSPVPSDSYHWNFGDGTRVNGQDVSHTYTHAGTYSVNLTVNGIDCLSAHEHSSITVTGYPTTKFELSKNRRYERPEIN